MQIRTRITREQVLIEESAGFAARQFHLSHYPFLWHYHPEVELTQIVRGQGMRFVGDSIEPFERGEICLLGSNLPHSWQSDPTAGRVHSRVIQLLPERWGESFWRLRELAGVRSLLERSRRGLLLGSEIRLEVARLIASLFCEPAESPRRIAIFLEILARLSASRGLRVISKDVLEPAHNMRIEQRLRQVLDRFHEGTGQTSQRELAQRSGLSPAAFSRFFRRQMGRTFTEYVSDWRIGRVCRMLSETDDAITDIAMRCGYENLSNFNRRFKQATALSPRQYRRLVRQADRG